MAPHVFSHFNRPLFNPPLKSNNEAWEFYHMVQAWATMHKDMGGWGNLWVFRGIKVPFFFPSLFLWARTEGCHGDEVGPSPTAWSGKSSSLLWHLLRLQETEMIKQGSTQTCPQRGRREDEAFENGSSIKTDGLNNGTWKSWVLKHMENWFSLSLHKPFCFFLVSIHPQLLSLVFVSCQRVGNPTHISILIMSTAQHMHITTAKTWEQGVQTQCPHKHIHTKTMAILLRGKIARCQKV